MVLVVAGVLVSDKNYFKKKKKKELSSLTVIRNTEEASMDTWEKSTHSYTESGYSSGMFESSKPLAIMDMNKTNSTFRFDQINSDCKILFFFSPLFFSVSLIFFSFFFHFFFLSFFHFNTRQTKQICLQINNNHQTHKAVTEVSK